MIQLPINYLGCQLDPNWNTYVNLYGPDDELPLLDTIDILQLDLETSSGDPKKASINPHSENYDETSGNLHRGCNILGIAGVFNDDKIPFYVPVRHYYLGENDEKLLRASCPNIPVQKVYTWLRELFKRTKVWWNHNIKYDAHVIKNELGFFPRCKLIDTLTRCKLGPFEERFEYGLTSMMRLFGKDISVYEDEIKKYLPPRSGKKDYALVPPDCMGVYAAVDVLAVQFIRNLLFKIAPDIFGNNSSENTVYPHPVVELEDAILPMLITMEQIGLNVDIKKCAKDWENINKRQLQRIKYIKAKSGIEFFDPSKKASQKELFCDTLGLKIDFTTNSLEKYEKGEITEGQMKYSFGYASLMKHYKKYPRIINAWNKYQEDEKLLTSFTIPYIEKHVTSDGLIHFWLNQLVRTGRMSCSSPNTQQLPPRAKEYIIPYNEDYILVDFDLSQIEFRVIVHYIENKAALEAFKNDPKTDFHTWVAEMCGIPRKPAKNINFMLGYGGGRGKCIAMLQELPEIIGSLSSQDLINRRANEVYDSYHRTLKELKPNANRAAAVMRDRGYVQTLLGRRRYLPFMFAHKAFNSVCQGSAADIQKMITLRLKKFIGVDCLLHCLVHDSWLFSIKKDKAAEYISEIKHEIEQPLHFYDSRNNKIEVPFSVPIVCDFGTSTKNWKDCDNNKGRIAA